MPPDAKPEYTLKHAAMVFVTVMALGTAALFVWLTVSGTGKKSDDKPSPPAVVRPDPAQARVHQWSDLRLADKAFDASKVIGLPRLEIQRALGLGEVRDATHVNYSPDGYTTVLVAYEEKTQRAVGVEVPAAHGRRGALTNSERAAFLDWLGVVDGAKINGRGVRVVERFGPGGAGLALYDVEAEIEADRNRTAAVEPSSTRASTSSVGVDPDFSRVKPEEQESAREIAERLRSKCASADPHGDTWSGLRRIEIQKSTVVPSAAPPGRRGELRKDEFDLQVFDVWELRFHFPEDWRFDVLRGNVLWYQLTLDGKLMFATKDVAGEVCGRPAKKWTPL